MNINAPVNIAEIQVRIYDAFEQGYDDKQQVYEDLEDQIIDWCKIARETSNAPTEYLRVAVDGDGTGLDAGQVRQAANWLTHEDAIEGNFNKLVHKEWDNIWIPFWFPGNMMAFKK